MTNQIPTISWRRLLSEGAVIVLSILFALWADAWWENYKERREEQEVLTALQIEFLDNEQNVTEHMEQVLVAIQGCIVISQMTEAQKRQAKARRKIDAIKAKRELNAMLKEEWGE